MLGTVFLVAVPVDDLLYRYFLRRQARQFAEIWIDAVRHAKGHHEDVYKAHQLTLDPKRRRSLETNLADFYRQNPKSREMLNLFVKERTMRTLFALGTDAEIRFYETAAQNRQESSDVVQQTYAVTYPDERGQRKSFFITLLMQRSVDISSGRAGWTMVHVDGNVRPPGW